MAFTGDDSELETCRFCRAERWHPNSRRPQKKFQYIPLIPRLLGFYRSARMSQQLAYRADYEHDPAKIRDVFDGAVYRNVCQKRPKIGNETLPHQCFSDRRDIALGLAGDGFRVFKRMRKGKANATALILINYNVPPEERTHQENVLSLAIIPGESEPKDTNTFLHPYLQESIALARGVDAYDAAEHESFSLHAYDIDVIGDSPMIAKFQCMKGPNGKCPCRECPIHGIYYGPSRHYYFPITSPHPNPRSHNLHVLLNERRRKHEDFIIFPREILAANPGLRAELSKHYGMNYESIFTQFPAIDMSKSFPIDFMHLIFENLVPNLIEHWIGEFGLDQGDESYELDAETWAAIGNATEAATETIPQVFVSALPNIATQRYQFTAEMYAFWIMHIAPLVLKDAWADNKYYKHVMDLVHIIKTCTKRVILTADLPQLERDIQKWVKTYEK